MNPPGNFREFVGLILDLLALVVPLLFAIAILTILWAGAQTILHSDNPQKLSDGRTTMFWGIILLFVMIGMWAFVTLLRNTFFI